MIRLLLLALLTLGLGGCASEPDKVYWHKLYAEDEYYKWVCQVDQSKKVRSWEGPSITFAEQFDGQCFRTFKPLKPRQP